MNTQRGSIMVYIFLGIILFAMLSYTVAGMLRTNGNPAGKDVTRLQVQSLLEYAQQAKIVVQQMKIDGVATGSLIFLKSGDAGYTTAPHTAKVFHPNGGGLPIPVLTGIVDTAVTSPEEGVYMTRTAIDGVDTTADEVVLSVRGVTQAVCEQINKELLGSTTIPSTGAANHDDIFVNGTQDLTTALCASCVGIQSMCVQETTPVDYTFYSVVDPN